MDLSEDGKIPTKLETVASGLLSVFMSGNRKYNFSHSQATGLSDVLCQIPEPIRLNRPVYERISTQYQCKLSSSSNSI